MDAYKVIISGGSGEITEKKSRFIATVGKTESEEEALSFIEEMKKKYWDARHNCYAYVLGAKGEILRYSDDGEPGGTAGKPILEVLLGEEIRNVCVVVTRYFGGTLLGTGGLVRAYTQAAQEGLKACRVGMMRSGMELKIGTDYNDVGKILYILGNHNIRQTGSDYGEKVSLDVIIPADMEKLLNQEITDATNGRAFIEKLRKLEYVDRYDS